MDGILPFGCPHRQKRSHAQMERQERSASSASPAWTSHHQHPSHDSNAHLHTRYCPAFQEQRAPLNLRFFGRRSSSDVPRHTPPAQPATTSAERPDTSGLHLPELEGMSSSAPRRYPGDGFDYRRPAGSRLGQDATPVDLSGEEEDNDNDDIINNNNTHMHLARDIEDVIDLTEDDSGYGPSQDATGGMQGSNHGEETQHSNQQQNQHHDEHQPAYRAPRLPRGMHAIIDLDSGQEEWTMETPPAHDPGSPEIQFVSSRPLDPLGRGYTRSNSEGDDVEFVRSQALPEAERRRRRDRDVDRALDLIGDMNGRFTHLRAQVERFNAQVNRTAASLRRTPVLPPRGAPRARGMVHVGFAAPGLLDFDMVGFDLGIEPARAPAPPPPTYQAPNEAPDGFTRSPEEEGELVCPNCEEELCVGDDDVKRQVWIVKTCGHVYCGECTANRSVKRSSKGKERPARTRPFKECAVEGCDSKVTNAKSMFQIFL